MGNGDFLETISEPMGLFKTDAARPPKPEAMPEAPPPLTMEDENIKQATQFTRSRLQSSRKKARLLSTRQSKSYKSTLG